MESKSFEAKLSRIRTKLDLGVSDGGKDMAKPSERDRREFYCSDCVERLAGRLGVQREAGSMTGSLIMSLKLDQRQSRSVLSKIKAESDSAWADVALREGIKLSKAGKYEEAIECYTQSVSLDPKNCDVYVAKGAALANLGNYAEALDDFDKALSIDPSDRNAIEYKKRIESRQNERWHVSRPQSSQLVYREGGPPLLPAV